MTKIRTELTSSTSKQSESLQVEIGYERTAQGLSDKWSVIPKVSYAEVGYEGSICTTVLFTIVLKLCYVNRPFQKLTNKICDQKYYFYQTNSQLKHYYFSHSNHKYVYINCA